MKSDDSNQSQYGGFLLRLGVYALVFAVASVFPIIELKTGIPLGRYRPDARYHDPLSWSELWTQLPATLFPYFVGALVLIALLEWNFHRKMKGASSILEYEYETDDSPPKRFTRLWLVSTIGYFAVAVIAFCVHVKGGWDWGLPPGFPFAVFAPVFVSLGVLAIYTGEFRLRGGTFYRNKKPIWYWSCVAAILSFGAFLFLGWIGVVGK